MSRIASVPELKHEHAGQLTHSAPALRAANTRYATLAVCLCLAAILALSMVIRTVGIQKVGFNTDEAVYAGQAAGILNNADLKPFFPVFRAHPLLFQFIIALVYSFTGVNDVAARLVSVAIGAITVLAVFALGKIIYGSKTGLLAALFVAVMPYHVIVTRQVLLDGLMTLCATLTLCSLALYGKTHHARWLYAAGLCMGLTFLAKETGIILIGSVYLFLALSPSIKLRIRDLIISLVLMGMVVAMFPIATTLAGGARSGQSYLIWQLLRRPNHEFTFYFTTSLPMIGSWLLLIAVIGVILLWKQRSWRETLLVWWALVPFAFFQIWPVKGFQYLLPMAPAIAVLGARTILYLVPMLFSKLQVNPAGWLSNLAQAGISLAIVLSLAIPSWDFVNSVPDTGGMAGTGGLPGGRETGLWFKENTLPDAQIMAIGPTIANPIQFYGHRKTHMLSISANPLQRNPSYDPIVNPDRQLRNGDVHYIVWDAYSAGRSKFFSDKLMSFVHRYNGQPVHSEVINGREMIIVYEVRP